MTTRRTDLISALSLIQNHPAHSHHDILTITACAPAMTEEQLLAHIDANMRQIAHWADFGGSSAGSPMWERANMRRRYSKVCHEALPSLKTKWRLERRMRQAECRFRVAIHFSGTINTPHVGDVLLHTSIGTLRIVPSGAVRRA